jgi:hypothetical protein
MSLYQVNKFLRDLSRSSDFVRRCQNGLSPVLEEYELNTEERGALREWEIKQLYEMGANPLLLLTSSMAMGKDIGSYVAALRKKDN